MLLLFERAFISLFFYDIQLALGSSPVLRIRIRIRAFWVTWIRIRIREKNLRIRILHPQ